jgi:uncharacterized protein (DUF2236 family)
MAFQHPVPLVARPALRLNNLMIKGTLPERVRSIFAIDWDPPQEVSFRAIAGAIADCGEPFLAEQDEAATTSFRPHHSH